MVDGQSATRRVSRYMQHGSVLQVGGAVLRLRLFAGLETAYHARFQPDPEPAALYYGPEPDPHLPGTGTDPSAEVASSPQTETYQEGEFR